MDSQGSHDSLRTGMHNQHKVGVVAYVPEEGKCGIVVVEERE